jgi:multiple sugar transport system permease protein
MLIKKGFLHIFLAITGLLTLVPFIWMISASFMSDGQSTVYPPSFYPAPFTIIQYNKLFIRLDVAKNLFNSIFVSVSVTFVSLFFNSLAAYAFAKYRFRGRDSLFKLLLSSMIIPAQVTMLPLFLMLKTMGLINTYMAIIIPGMANIFGIFLLRQYMFSIPDSLIEAARMDGATEFQIYRRVILPLCKPILVTLAIFTFLGTWNDFMWPLVALTDSSMYTLPVALANLMGEHAKDPELMMAGSVITILPVIIVFVILQRYYMQGIMLGAIKE